MKIIENFINDTTIHFYHRVKLYEHKLMITSSYKVWEVEKQKTPTKKYRNQNKIPEPSVFDLRNIQTVNGKLNKDTLKITLHQLYIHQYKQSDKEIPKKETKIRVFFRSVGV